MAEASGGYRNNRKTRASRAERAALIAACVFAAAGVAAAALSGWDETLEALGRIGLLDILILLALSLANYGLRGWRWLLFSDALGCAAPARANAVFYVAGFAFTATPGKVGELARLWWLRAGFGVSLARGGALTIADRGADLAAVALLAAFSSAWASGSPVAALIAGAISLSIVWMVFWTPVAQRAVGAAYGAIDRAPRLFATLRGAARAVRKLGRRAVAAPGLALGLLGWAAEALAFAWLLSALGLEIAPMTAVFIFTAAMLVGALSGLPGGLGGVEATMLGLLALAGAPFEPALAATAVIRATTLWFAIALGFAALPIALRTAAGQERPA